MLRQPIYPILIALYPILTFYNVNSQYHEAEVIIVPAVASVVLIGVIWALLFLVFGNFRKSALVLLIIVIFFWAYTYLYEMLYDVRVDLGFVILGPNNVILGLFVLIVFISILLSEKVQQEFSRLTLILNTACLVLIALPASGIVWDKLAPAALEQAAREQTLAVEAPQGESSAGQFPDIFHIVLDAYARQDRYRELYRYDNADLIEFLEDQGFYVVRQAHANYSWTAPSIASSMNMNYLEQVLPEIAEDVTDRTHLFFAIRYNQVFEILRDKGYRIVAFESGMPATDFDWQDVTIHSPNPAGIWGLGLLDEFQAGLLASTPVPRSVEALFGSDRVSQNALRRQYIDYALENLGRSASEPDGKPGTQGPKLVFAHIVAPHAPHLFKEDGTPFDPPMRPAGPGQACRMEGAERDIFIDGHTSYVRYLNKRLKQALRRIVDNATRDFVIIVQSDHGPQTWCQRGNILDPLFIRDRLAILTAIYIPDQRYENLYQSMTPVNIYRTLFNTVFGAEFDLLPDKIHINTFANPYHHIPIRKDQLE